MALPLPGVTIFPCSVSHNEESLRAAMDLVSPEWKTLIRLMGGCGGMSPDDVSGMSECARRSFKGFRGGIVIGGSRMYDRAALKERRKVIVPGITEMIDDILDVAPNAVVIGVAPRQSDLVYIEGFGNVISDGEDPFDPTKNTPYITFIHPSLKLCLLLQYSADRPLDSWSHEWKTALRYMEMARTGTQAGFRTAYVVYNGGRETEKELQYLVRFPQDPSNPRTIVLISDSGRVATQYANDPEFRTTHADKLVVCTKDELPDALKAHGITQPQEAL
jgi:hypothetical protein